jgi:hypothetical protein
LVDFDLIRREVVRAGRYKANRISSRDFGVPDDWAPMTVINPVTGVPFTESEAWNLICSLLESGHPFQNLLLDSPKHMPAIQTTYSCEGGLPTIYIKVHLFRGKICGRSFHSQLISGKQL